MLSARLQPGFTLIELIIGLAVFGLLMSAALPAFTTWIGNTKIRTAAEALNNGIQLSRSEAIRSGALVEFQMTGGSKWRIVDANSGALLQERQTEEGSSGVVISIEPAASTKLTFHPLGIVRDKNLDDSAPVSAIKVDSSALAAAESRELCIMVTSAGVVRMCDPHVAGATDTRACLPAVPPVCQ